MMMILRRVMVKFIAQMLIVVVMVNVMRRVRVVSCHVIARVDFLVTLVSSIYSRCKLNVRRSIT